MTSNTWFHSMIALALPAVMAAGACSSDRQAVRETRPVETAPAAAPEQPEQAREQPAAPAQRPYEGKGYPETPVTGVAGLGPAPDAVIIDAGGQSVSLAGLWQSNNVLLVFYRGHW